jgi:hypothetical protein
MEYMAENAALCFAVEVSDTTMLTKEFLPAQKNPQAYAYGLSIVCSNTYYNFWNLA